VADYRAEFHWNHPDVPPDAAEIATGGFDSRLFYRWHMVRGLVETARLVAVHGEPTRRALSESLPNAEKIISIRLGHGQLVGPVERTVVRRGIRARYAIADDVVLFGAFGGLTPEKRIPQVLAAFNAVLPHAPGARLLLAGAAAAHYDVLADIAARGLADRVIVTGYLETDEELTDHLAACDVSLNLRWPTAGETSGAWLRALAAGVATVITDLAHLGDVPSLDPRTWTKNEEVGACGLGLGDRGSGLGSSVPQTPNPKPQAPACIAIDILDEDHSLRVAMRRLAQDVDLRDALGRAGQAWWLREHSLEVMVEDYERLIASAAARLIDSAAGRPAEARNAGEGGPLRPDGDAKLRALLRPFGIESPLTPQP